MAAKVGDFSLILKLLGGIIIGALLGLYIGENAEGSLKHVMDVVVSLRHIFGQIIFFLVPLVIVGFITPAIVRLGQNASKILLVAVALAYVSSLGAALFSMISGYCIIPNLSIATSTETLRSLPEMVFRLDIPPLFSVMSALVLALTMTLFKKLGGRSRRLDQVRDPGQDLLRDGTHHDRPGQPHHDPHPAFLRGPVLPGPGL